MLDCHLRPAFSSVRTLSTLIDGRTIRRPARITGDRQRDAADVGLAQVRAQHHQGITPVVEKRVHGVLLVVETRSAAQDQLIARRLCRLVDRGQEVHVVEGVDPVHDAGESRRRSVPGGAPWRRAGSRAGPRHRGPGHASARSLPGAVAHHDRRQGAVTRRLRAQRPRGTVGFRLLSAIVTRWAPVRTHRPAARRDWGMQIDIDRSCRFP